MKSLLIIIQLMLLFAGYTVFLNQWIEPRIFPYFNLFSIGFPVIFILNGILLFFWWFYRWKTAVIFTLFSLGFLIPLNKIILLNPIHETHQSNLKLITYNVRYFFNDRDAIVNFLKKENADIVLIQEMGQNPEYIIDNASSDQKYYFQNYNSLGIASKYPIIETQSFNIKPYPTTFVYTDIALPNDTVRFITFYLESWHIDQAQFKKTDEKHIKRNAKNLAQKVVRTARIHRKQIELIQENVKKSPYPVIMAGDLNAVPSSYEYFAMSRKHKDAFLYGEKCLGTTFPGLGIPLRLDYVFVPEEIKIKSHQIKKVNHSDHYPVIVELEIPK